MLYDASGQPIISEHESERGQEKEHSSSADSESATKPTEPPHSHPDSYEEKNYRLQKRGLWIQALLCIFTALAFGAAAYYAHVANLQAALMQRQLETTDRAWIKIAGAELIEDLAFERDRVRDENKLNVFIAVPLSAENIGRSVALNAMVEARALLWQDLFAEELAQATACNGDNWGSGVQLVAEYIGPFSIFPSETRQFKVFWNGQIDAKYRGRDVSPHLVGCVIYFLPNSQQPHYSAFAYRVQYRPANPIQPWEKRPIKVGLDAKKMDLIAWPTSGLDSFFDAN
jgi:hypothetical protein